MNSKDKAHRIVRSPGSLRTNLEESIGSGGPYGAVSRCVFMFSGQGSHYYQMGRELFESNYTFHDWMVRLDEVVRRSSSPSVLETLYDEKHGKGDPFDRTLLTHPAIFMVEYSLAQTLIQLGISPDLVLGASLGSFAAAAIAGFLAVDEALHAVIRQAVAFENCCEPGGMTAVLADPKLFDVEFIANRSTLAAVNCASHFVISGKHPGLSEIECALAKQDISYQRLPVSFPFHSEWIDKARNSFEPFVSPVRHRKGRLPLVCCEQAAILSELSGTYFWDVVRHPIRFRETIEWLEQYGSHRYIDAGPAGTLATFLRYNLAPTSNSTVHSILTPYALRQQSLAKLVALTRPEHLPTMSSNSPVF